MIVNNFQATIASNTTVFFFLKKVIGNYVINQNIKILEKSTRHFNSFLYVLQKAIILKRKSR